MAMILLKKVVVEPTEVKTGAANGPTIGELIDQLLVKAAEKDEPVIEISFHVEEDEWRGLRDSIRGELGTASADDGWPVAAESRAKPRR